MGEIPMKHFHNLLILQQFWNISNKHKLSNYYNNLMKLIRLLADSSCTTVPSERKHAQTQMVRRLFFRKPSHHEYLEKVIKFEIIELNQRRCDEGAN